MKKERNKKGRERGKEGKLLNLYPVMIQAE